MLFEEYLREIPLLHTWDFGKTWSTGGFDRHLLEKLHDFLRDRLPDNPVILETGAGNSTITMLFLQPARLISIDPDAELFERIRGFCEKNGIPDFAIEAYIDASQWVLPRLATRNRTSDPILDFVSIDGCHGWPTSFVDLEYTNSMLRQGGYLMIDDVNLHTEKEMARLLSEHPAFTLALDLGKSLVFGKQTADRNLGDFYDQPYNVRRTREYARFPHSYSLRDPPALYLTKMPYWMKSLLRRLRYRL